MSSEGQPTLAPNFDKDLSEEAAIDFIARSLKEPNRDLICEIVDTIGVEKSLQYYNETVVLEEYGGMEREDGSGRKSAGGVFFHLISHDKAVFTEELRRIFAESAHKKERLRRQLVKEERKRKSQQLKARFIQEGLLKVPDL